MTRKNESEFTQIQSIDKHSSADLRFLEEIAQGGPDVGEVVFRDGGQVIGLIVCRDDAHKATVGATGG